ncbi:MAG TPA: hypothetical protein VER03_19425 [Bryobacteraceae bacterium]|nr:hypothetical protein [Bryobacteraceae bacterium]
MPKRKLAGEVERAQIDPPLAEAIAWALVSTLDPPPRMPPRRAPAIQSTFTTAARGGERLKERQ